MAFIIPPKNGERKGAARLAAKDTAPRTMNATTSGATTGVETIPTGEAYPNTRTDTGAVATKAAADAEMEDEIHGTRMTGETADRNAPERSVMPRSDE